MAQRDQEQQEQQQREPVATPASETERDRARLADLMGRMAADDRSAVFELYAEQGHRVAGAMRSHLASLGVPGVAREDLDGLVMDACLALYDCAGAWRPDGGALPWTWAAARLRAIAIRWVGLHADELDEAVLEREDPAGAAPVAGGRAPEGRAHELLRGLARHHAGAALLLDGLAQVGSPRDQAIVLELRLQGDLGDPSPSHTVAADFAVSPDAVRQVNSRIRRRLRRLADRDERYAPLAALPLVA
ncbi:MAG: hypothetical protein KDB10_09890 [Acidimicrobiales bacterium]|nr:hypothetical protein [Acidimicrobiales bacterium]